MSLLNSLLAPGLGSSSNFGLGNRLGLGLGGDPLASMFGGGSSLGGFNAPFGGLSASPFGGGSNGGFDMAQMLPLMLLLMNGGLGGQMSGSSSMAPPPPPPPPAPTKSSFEGSTLILSQKSLDALAGATTEDQKNKIIHDALLEATGGSITEDTDEFDIKRAALEKILGVPIEAGGNKNELSKYLFDKVVAQYAGTSIPQPDPNNTALTEALGYLKDIE